MAVGLSLFSRTILLLCRYAVLCVCVLSVARAADAQNGTITGTVTDAATSQPLPTTVTVQRYTLDGTLAGTVNLNASGQYVFQDVVPNNYFVRIGSSTPYIPELYNDIPCAADDCRVTGGTVLTVNPGGTTVVNFALTHGGLISGTVRLASNNQAVTTGMVQLFNASTSFVQNVPTGVDGSFLFSGLPTGTYYARAHFAPTAQRQGLAELYGGVLCPEVRDPLDINAFKHVDSSCRIQAGTPIAVTAGTITSGIDFLLDAPATIAGRVSGEGTAAGVSATVSVFLGNVEVATGSTVADGQYQIGGLYPGIYRVRTRAVGNFVDEWLGNICVGCAGTPQSLTVGAGAAITGIDFSLATGGGITGTVSCVLPAPSDWFFYPQIYVYSASAELVRIVTLPVHTNGGCSSQSFSAAYAAEGLAAGQYYLLARDPLIAASGTQPRGGHLVDTLYGGLPCVASDCDVRRGIPVTVTQGAVTPSIDFLVARGADLAGSFGPMPPVQVFDARGVELVNVIGPTQFVAGQTIVGLPPGTYYVKYGNMLNGRIFCIDCPPTSGKPIVIRPGDISFSIDMGGGSTPYRLSGAVTDGSAAALSTITVELLTAGGQLLATTSTDQFGLYVFPTLSAGTYFVRTRNDRGFADEIYQDVACASCDPRLGTPIVIANADAMGINFALASGGTLGGETREAGSSVVVGNVPVSIFSTGGALAGQVTSDNSGVFRVNLPAGSYRARAEPTPVHGAEVYSEVACTSAACDTTAGTPIAVTGGAMTPNVGFTLASCSAMTLSPSILARGVVGTLYRQVFTTSGGAGDKSYSVTEGVLPAGVVLNANGTLEGTPTLAGRYDLTIGAIDVAGCATSRALTMDVHNCAFTLSPASATVPAGGGPVTVNIVDGCGTQAVGTPAFVSVQSNTPGQIVLSVQANTDAAPRQAAVTIGRRVFELRQGGIASQPPFGAVDAPLDGAQVSGSMALGGWALDDLEVRHVQIFRDPVGSEAAGEVFLGNAVFVRGARPDVEAAYRQYPLSDRGGWGFLILTNMLPNQGNGAFRIHAYAEDVEGTRTLLGSRTVIGTNATAVAPFGNIDTPAQGATISGTSYINFGWALTPQPKIIPIDGSTIRVYVDGQPLGSPNYNFFRSDVSSAFPGLRNTAGPVGYRAIDSTALAEGQHTIAWVVTDDQGAASGIGSRYFHVANSADAQPLGQGGIENGRRTESVAAMTVSETQSRIRASEGSLRRVHATIDRDRPIALKPMDRLELALGEAEKGCAGTWAGYLVDKDTLTDLPVGASIDRAGIFYWQPGAGFQGTFDLVFVRTACDGGKTRLGVRVQIEP